MSLVQSIFKMPQRNVLSRQHLESNTSCRHQNKQKEITTDSGSLNLNHNICSRATVEFVAYYKCHAHPE